MVNYIFAIISVNVSFHTKVARLAGSAFSSDHLGQNIVHLYVCNYVFVLVCLHLCICIFIFVYIHVSPSFRSGHLGKRISKRFFNQMTHTVYFVFFNIRIIFGYLYTLTDLFIWANDYSHSLLCLVLSDDTASSKLRPQSFYI